MLFGQFFVLFREMLPSLTIFYTVNPRISSFRGLFFEFLLGGLFKGGLFRGGAKNIFQVVGQIPLKICVLKSYFFLATHTSNRMFFEEQGKFR